MDSVRDMAIEHCLARDDRYANVDVVEEEDELDGTLLFFACIVLFALGFMGGREWIAALSFLLLLLREDG